MWTGSVSGVALSSVPSSRIKSRTCWELFLSTKTTFDLLYYTQKRSENSTDKLCFSIQQCWSLLRVCVEATVRMDTILISQIANQSAQISFWILGYKSSKVSRRARFVDRSLGKLLNLFLKLLEEVLLLQVLLPLYKTKRLGLSLISRQSLMETRRPQLEWWTNLCNIFCAPLARDKRKNT